MIVDIKVTLLLWSLVAYIIVIQDYKFHIFSIYRVILTDILKSQILTWARRFWAFSLFLRQDWPCLDSECPHLILHG